MGDKTAGEEQPRRQRGSGVHNLPVVVFLVFGPPTDGRAVVVAGGTRRPARHPDRGGAGSVAAWHGALRSSVGRGIQDVPVHVARLRPRGHHVSTRDPAHRTAGRARARAGFRGELFRGGISGPRATSLSGQRPGARYGSTPRRKSGGKRADDVRPHPHELARGCGHGSRPGPARGRGRVFPVRREGLVLGAGHLPQRPAAP